MSVASLAHDYLMMPVERFAAEHGAALPEEGVNGPAVIRVRLLEILDPASQTRSRVISGVIQQMAADAAMSKEPELREALAIAYGQQLSVSELQELDRFLATPVGTKFAHFSHVGKRFRCLRRPPVHKPRNCRCLTCNYEAPR
jgi:hypothetical protein